MLENGLLVKGSIPEEGLEELTAGLASTEEIKPQQEGGADCWPGLNWGDQAPVTGALGT